MNAQSRLPRDHPARRDGAPPRPGADARRGPGHPWAQSPLPGRSPLEGKIHSPRSKALTPPRRRGRWLTVGLPSVLGATLGISSFLVLGVSSLIGGAGLLAPLAAGLGIAVITGGGSGLLLRNRAPQPPRLGRSEAEIPTATRSTFEKIVRDTRLQRRRLHRMRRRTSGRALAQILDRAETMLLRIDALLGSASLQARRASDGDVMMLEGMADRYLPELIDALESSVGFLAPTTAADARDRAIENLEAVDEQLVVLGGRLDRLENDLISGVTHSLDVHAEFLRARFADERRDEFLEH